MPEWPDPEPVPVSMMMMNNTYATEHKFGVGSRTESPKVGLGTCSTRDWEGFEGTRWIGGRTAHSMKL